MTGGAGFGTAGVLSGNVRLAGDSAIEFASGQITSLAASAALDLNGNDAFIEDSTAPGSNSALTGLASIGAGALFDLDNGASVSTTGALVNDGTIQLDLDRQRRRRIEPDGGGDADQQRWASSDIWTSATATFRRPTPSPRIPSSTAGRSIWSATGRIWPRLDVSGATTNNGSISITTDTEELAGAVGGTGSFSLSNANLQFNSSVSAGQTINESGADALILEQAQKFPATISGFGTGDTIDAANFLLSATTYNFVENSGTGGTLTLHDAEPDRQYP